MINFKKQEMKHSILILLILFLFSSQSNGQLNSIKTNTQKVKVIGHAHMDPVYRWRWNEIENREIYKTFSDVLNVLNKYPELQFAQSSLLYYSSLQKQFPSLFKKVKQSIRDKKWSVVGGQWVEIDESMPSGESIIRQFLISNDYYSRNLDIDNIDIQAFLSSGKSLDTLVLEASVIREKFKTGSWILGAFLGLVIAFSLLNQTTYRKKEEYRPDKGNCYSCARCMEYCPVEK